MAHDILVGGIAFDIDETLSDTNNFWIDTLIREYGKPDHLTRADIVRLYRYTERAPFWQIPGALAWMEEARTSSEMQKRIPLIGNANHIVERVHAIVPIAAYITARPERVREGTLWWLENHSFPQAPLLMKPDEVPFEESAAWKSGLLAELYPSVRGIVDDNPGLIEHLPEGYEGTIFLYDHPEVARTGLNIVLVPTWGHVLPAVLRHLG